MRKVIVLTLLLFVVVGIGSVAASGAEPMPWDTTLQKLANAVSGNTAKFIGIIMVVVAAIMMMVTQGQGVQKLVWVVGGIGLATSATSFVTNFMGFGAGALVETAPTILERILAVL